ncbi:MAG: hypothetical protein M1821_008605 [Bathelium mastoideum]|nr:MAG: hypothetical protein M1821_008605 [Bathelium mastoideum]
MPENGEPASDQSEISPDSSSHGVTNGMLQNHTSKNEEVANQLSGPQPEPEKDEFGLPVKKPRRRTSDEDGGEHSPTAAESKETPFRDPENGAEEVREPARSAGLEEDVHEQSEAVNGTAAEVNGVKSKEEGEANEEVNFNAASHGTSDQASPQVEEKFVLHDIADQPRPATNKNARASKRDYGYYRTNSSNDVRNGAGQVSEYSHQQLAAPSTNLPDVASPKSDEWQEMPALAPYDIYDDDGHLVAQEAEESDEEAAVYGGIGGAGKGYTKVQIDEDAESATSMDDNTAYLFKDPTTTVTDEDADVRDPLAQMQATKDLLTEGQRIAYVGVAKVAMEKMIRDLDALQKTKGAKKALELGVETMQMWSQKAMLKLYQHMEIKQIMIEQLASHGVEPGDLTPVLMQNARVKNPVADDLASGTDSISERGSISDPTPSYSEQPSVSSARSPNFKDIGSPRSVQTHWSDQRSPRFPSDLKSPPPYQEVQQESHDLPEVRTPSQLPKTKNLDIDLRWTVLCDLFLVLIADSTYDARSRTLLEKVGGFLAIEWLDICRFEKRVTDALEMQEAADKENWNEEEHMENRRKLARNRRLVMMGLATVGGGLVIGLSAGLLAPVIGAGLAAGFTTIGVAGTGSFLAGAGGAAIVTTTGVVTGGTIGVRAANRRTGAVKTFEYRPLHNNKRVNLIVTVAGWMTGKVDDVRLPFSTVDPIMGDIYSVLWEPEMLSSMGQTINILATEALTQGLQQILGSTILVALMAGLQLPIVLTKLSYLIDNPWNVSLARAEQAGLILADSLIDRNLGARPITLVGFSLGCRLIFSCLRELARKGAHGLIQNVYMFGSPIVANTDEFLKLRTVVSGRWVNGYATNDWILGYLFRATAGGIGRVAGLAPVEIAGVENFDVTELVPGHMAYRPNLPRLLRHVGWLVESDEFAEIEDADPENHEKRQRELINEIEEARKELQESQESKDGGKKKAKFGFGKLWGPKKKAVEKKDWETYDEQIKSAPDGEVDPTLAGEGVAAAVPGVKDDRVIFDVDAIRREAADLAIHGVEIRQLESTLPPMKLDITSATPTSAHSVASWNGTATTPNAPPALRQTHSYDATSISHRSSARPSTDSTTSYTNTLHPLAKARTSTDAPPPPPYIPAASFDPLSRRSSRDDNNPALTFERPRSPAVRVHSQSPARIHSQSPPAAPQPKSATTRDVSPAASAGGSAAGPRPAWEAGGGARFGTGAAAAGSKGDGGTAAGGAAVGLDPLHNAWADEETGERGGGGLEITFE